MSTTPTHRRTITLESFDGEGEVTICATLTDERPWADGEELTQSVHDMTLTVVVDRRRGIIDRATADMRRFPHLECPSIEPAVRSLAGISVSRGYNKAVAEVLGRQRGCTHLEFLARAVGPMVIQAMASTAARQAGPTGIGNVVRDDIGGWLTNTCHLWAAGGIGAAKLAEGWRPGSDAYPAPLLVDIRRREPR